jgi:vacuolar-type H+-ATPase subunit F/Vma7
MALTRTVVAIGPEQEMLYLKCAGVAFVPLERGEDLEEPVRRQARDPEVGLIIVSETVAEGRHDVIGDVRHDTGTAVLVVPSHRGSTGSTESHMRHVLEQSIGVDLLSKD